PGQVRQGDPGSRCQPSPMGSTGTPISQPADYMHMPAPLSVMTGPTVHTVCPGMSHRWVLTAPGLSCIHWMQGSTYDSVVKSESMPRPARQPQLDVGRAQGGGGTCYAAACWAGSARPAA